MKLEALRRSLMRLFGPRATSVSHRIEPASFNTTCFRHNDCGGDKGPCTYPSCLTPDVALISTGVTATGLKPPPDPAVDQPWCWSEWVRERESIAVPGWAYCRFPIRFPRDRAVFVFGIVRQNFGLYPTPYRDGIITCVTHLQTGVGIGLFANRHVAAQACELAEKIDDWHRIDPQETATWGPVVARCSDVWHAAGIVCVNTTVINGQVAPIFSMTPETMMQDRPEKLS